MIKPKSDKPKRGAKFIVIETGESVTLNRVKENGSYFCETDTGFDIYSASDLKTENPGRSQIAKKPVSVEKKALKDDLTEFFNSLEIPFNCENCGKPLYASTQFAKRCVSAHILPKADFPTIATNFDNIVFMGAGIIGVCYCHDDYDKKGAQFRYGMPVYGIVAQRFLKLKEFLTPKELIKALKYLYIKIEI